MHTFTLKHNGWCHQVGLESGRENTNTDCVTPDAILDAQLISDNGSLSVNFSWTFENENSTICYHIFSVRSFQSIVPYSFEDKTEPRSPIYDRIRYTQVNQQTYHIFVDIDRATYYQFELRIQASLGTKSPRVYKHFSFLYYFGDQVPARVTEPAMENTIIRAYLGHSVRLPCSGTGTPVPDTWVLRHPYAEPPQICEACPQSKGHNIAWITEYKSGDYFCVSINILVSC